MRIYKDTVEIEGYGKFYRVCTFDKKSGLFGINYPERVVQDVKRTKTATKIDYVYARTYEEVHKNWQEAIDEFIALTKQKTIVILYTVDESSHRSDGSGIGFVFNYGVFIHTDIDGRDKYHFVRGADNTDPIHEGFHDYKFDEWKKMVWTEAREEFFKMISNGIYDLLKKLEYFVENCEEIIDKTIEAGPDAVTTFLLNSPKANNKR